MAVNRVTLNGWRQESGSTNRVTVQGWRQETASVAPVVSAVPYNPWPQLAPMLAQ